MNGIDRCVECCAAMLSERRARDVRVIDGVPVVESRGRGLCSSCYHRNVYAGTLADFERKTRPAAEMLEEIGRLRAEGFTRQQIADRMDVCRDAIDKAISRARRRGLEVAA